MIKVHYILIPFILALLAACTKPAAEPVLFLEGDAVTFDYQGGTESVTFVSNHDWEASTDVQWCRVFPSSGSVTYLNDHSLYLVCDRNDLGYRACTVTIKSNGQEIKANVSQTPSSLYPDSKDYLVSHHEQTIAIPFTSEWPVRCELDNKSASWIHILETRTPVRDTVWLAISENRSVGRTSTLNITGEGRSIDVQIRQEAHTIPRQDYFAHYVYDTNYDGLICADEAEQMTHITLENLTSTEGLEYFTGITNLTITTKTLHEFDFSPFKKLQYVSFKGPLHEADFSQNKKMKSLEITGTEIVTLDLTAQNDLYELYAQGNPNLKTIYVCWMPYPWFLKIDDHTEIISIK